MTKRQYYLESLNEECSEVIQAVSKIVKHGVNNSHPRPNSAKNGVHLYKELCQLEAVMQWVSKDLGYGPIRSDPDKIARIERYRKRVV